MTLAHNTGFDPITINGLLATQWLMSEAEEENEVETEEVETEEDELEEGSEEEDAEEESDEE